MYCDSHAHLTSDTLYPDVEQILARAKAAGIAAIIDIATEERELQRSLALQKKHPLLFTAAGVHPHDAHQAEELTPIFAEAARKKQLIAIGETGLDYHYKHSTPEQQQRSLRQHLRLALECQIPVIIHCREAFADFFHILDDTYRTPAGHWGPGVLHCFTGTQQEAQEVLRRGWYLSFSGILSFKKSIELQEVAKTTPLDRILIETDAPFLAPQSKRGQRNEPTYVVEVAQKLADLHGIHLETVAKKTYTNAKTLFSFPDHQAM